MHFQYMDSESYARKANEVVPHIPYMIIPKTTACQKPGCKYSGQPKTVSPNESQPLLYSTRDTFDILRRTGASWPVAVDLDVASGTAVAFPANEKPASGPKIWRAQHVHLQLQKGLILNPRFMDCVRHGMPSCPGIQNLYPAPNRLN